MCQLVRERKHLRGLSVRTIDEHQRRKTVDQRKAAELFRLKRPSIVVEHNTAAHDHDAGFISAGNEKTESISPGRNPAAFFDIKTQSVTHGRRSRLNFTVQGHRANEVERRLSLR